MHELIKILKVSTTPPHLYVNKKGVINGYVL